MGVIASGYLGALLIAGAFLSVGSAMSALTRNQVIAFVLGVAVCFVFAAASYPLVTDFLIRNTPVMAEIARRFAVVDRYQEFTRGIVIVAGSGVLHDVHRVLAVPDHGARRSAQGGLNPCGVCLVFGHRRHRGGGDRHRHQHVRRCAAGRTCADLTRRQDLHAVQRHPADPGRPEGADHAAALLFAPARRDGSGLRHLCRSRARNAERIRRRLPRQGQGWNSTTPSRSATPRTAPSPTACRACRSITAATRCISASPAATWRTTNAPSRSSRPSANASWNSI